MAQTLLTTPVHDRHVALGARLVPFAGWEMPVQYEGVLQEHRAVRTDAGVFDVSHMGEIDVEGPRAHGLLQGLLSHDLDKLEPGRAQFTLLTHDSGGLGARDTLRLEACYPLHGNDISQTTDAISAGLGWTCALGKEFMGVAELRRIKSDGPARKLVAFVMEEKGVPRHGMPIDGGGE